MYKLTNPVYPSTETNCVIRTSDNAYIPFDPANVDFAQFKKNLADGVELQDADGTVIDGIAYLKELV
jgi:hypothetical protein